MTRTIANSRRTLRADDRIALALVAVAGIAVTLIGFLAALHSHQQMQAEEFRLASENRVAAVRREVESNFSGLSALRAFAEVGTDGGGLALNSQRFDRVAERLTTAYPAIHTFEWAPLVPGKDRAAFEAQLPKGSSGQIVYGSVPQALHRVKPQESYFPIQFVYPRKEKDIEKVLGFDLLSSAGTRRAMKRTTETGKISALGRLKLVEKSADRTGIAALLPVFGRTRQAPAGYALAVFQISRLIEAGLTTLRPLGIDIYVFDDSASEKSRFLYVHFSRLRTKPSTQLSEAELDALPGLRYSSVLDVGGRQWRLICVPTPESAYGNTSLQPWFVLLLGLAGTMGLMVYLYRHAEHGAQREVLLGQLSSAHEIAVAAARNKAQFLANMSHEIRTPMNGLLGMTEIVLDSPLNADQRQQLETAHTCGQNMVELLNKILDWSKIEAGKLTPETLPFNLRDEVENVLHLFALQAQDKGLELELVWEAGADHWFGGDPTRLRQILTNLIGNAIKFTASGAVRILVARVAPSEVSFCVADTGIGISVEAQRSIFSPFTQADGSTTRQYGGTGLGLAISAELIRLMGGGIFCRSEEGRGSEFTFHLPLCPVPPPQASSPGEQGALESGSVATCRVLLAEDNGVNQTVVRRMLEKLNCSVALAPNGSAAVAAFRAAAFDIVFMDCQMPELDGYAATREIRRHEAAEGLFRTPIIALTAHALDGDRELCIEAGMDDHLSKPINSERLAGALRVWSVARESPLQPS